MKRLQSTMKKLESEAAINARLRSIADELRRLRQELRTRTGRRPPERGHASDAGAPTPKGRKKT